MSEEIKTFHAHRLMTRLERMKENKIVCDFTIKVGNQSFPVHRTVLVASSDYFEGLFSSNMKEVREGFVEMKTLGVKAFEKSLNFMYTGSAEITMESVQEILHVADLFQLDGLKSLGFLFLLDNLSPNNCLSVVNLAETYNRPDVKEKAERIIISDLESVMSSEMFSLSSRPDLLRYISNVNYKTSWKAALTWAQDKEGFPQLIEKMDIKKFQHNSVRKLVIGALFLDAEELKNNLDLGNCIVLKLLAQNHGIDDTIIDVIIRFIEENFEEIVATPNFCDIGKDDVVRLLQSSEAKCSYEEVNWVAALKWTKHDLRKRQNVFPELFSQIKLESFPFRYLKDVISSENLVESSKKCSKALMDVVLAKAVSLEEGLHSQTVDSSATAVSAANTPQTVEGLVAAELPRNIIIDQQPDNGSNSVTYLFLGNYGGCFRIEFTFPSGCLQGISYPAQHFKVYLPATPHLKSRFDNAFYAGQIFKLQHQSGQTHGRIIWGEIPLARNREEALQRNLDRTYLESLDQALKSKGF